MASLFDSLSEAIQKGAHLPPDEAQRIAIQAIEWGADAGLGGVEHYWPMKVRAMPLKIRNAAIRQEFNGNNLKSICAKYQVSRTTVYEVISAKQ
tara:strand:- start:250962 stop:251243 length:282 start_codon:yes stop_codon:yes gene_type:complete